MWKTGTKFLKPNYVQVLAAAADTLARDQRLEIEALPLLSLYSDVLAALRGLDDRKSAESSRELCTAVKKAREPSMLTDIVGDIAVDGNSALTSAGNTLFQESHRNSGDAECKPESLSQSIPANLVAQHEAATSAANDGAQLPPGTFGCSKPPIRLRPRAVDLAGASAPPPAKKPKHSAGARTRVSGRLLAIEDSDVREACAINKMTRLVPVIDDARESEGTARESVRWLGLLDFKQIENNMSNLLSAIQGTVETLLTDVLHFHATAPSPFYWEANQDSRLASLYQTCWGADWGGTCRQLHERIRLPASEAMTALLSALLYREVLQEASPWQRFLPEKLTDDAALKATHTYDG